MFELATGDRSVDVKLSAAGKDSPSIVDGAEADAVLVPKVAQADIGEGGGRSALP